MKYSIKGQSLSEQLSNAAKIKTLCSEFLEPYGFVKRVLLDENIVRHNGKLYLKDKSTLTAYEFMQTENFAKALELVNRNVRIFTNKVIAIKPYEN